MGVDTVSKGMRVRELIDEYAHEKLKATPSWEAFSDAADSEYDRVVCQAIEEMKELERF